MNEFRSNPEYPIAKDLMETMVEHSQRPLEGNLDFVQVMQEKLDQLSLPVRVTADPEHNDRKLLAVDIGDPDGKQCLVATSHSDVVGVEGQNWNTDPWKLVEEGDEWVGRGTCDTHGTGVSMLLAGMREDVRRELHDAHGRVTIFFTYDEEATSKEFSMRGARMAAGLLGTESQIQARNFLIGEPTETDGVIVPMRAHKGRMLTHFTVEAPESGHVSQAKQNALMAAGTIIHAIGEYANMLRYGSRDDKEAAIYNPPFTTVQVSSGDVKSGDYSTTPDHVRFSVDMRTLPFVHEHRVSALKDLITSQNHPNGEQVVVGVEKDAPGSSTPADARIVRISEELTGVTSQGFNGGDDGRILRNNAGMQGVTAGPGDLRFAHMPNERISIESVLRAVDFYAKFFKRSILFNSSND
jgi:acetylornithine deacetylase